jgi:UDP-N-acetylmuramoyl-tripeptide--D-alanyl-D-alanine ligase
MATPIPDNRARFSVDEIVEITDGALVSGGVGDVDGVTSDSRADVSGKLFVALRGEHFDGHEFASQAAERGAVALVVEREVRVSTDAAVIRVDSSLDALAALAQHHRARWGGQVVAVAGSAGKTTTKSAIAALLSHLIPGAVHAVRGNLNNRVGVPMVLLGLLPAHRVAVVEIGTNALGEVDALARAARPDIGVLTLIALEHSEGLGDLGSIEAEEGALLAALGHDAVAVGNADDERVARRLRATRAQTRVSYGKAADATYRLVDRRPVGFDGAELTIACRGDTLRVRSGLFGEAGAYATLAALAVGDAVTGTRVPAEVVSRVLGEAGVGETGRLRPIPLADGSMILDDTYNANPASVLSSAEAAAEAARARGAGLVLVIGEMRELGAQSESAHADVGSRLGPTGAKLLVALGGDARHMVEPARRAGLTSAFAEDASAALALVRPRLEPGDVVLVKASRGVRAERVVEGLTGEGSAP